MSPFESTVEALSRQMRVLPARAQIQLFLTASGVLADQWHRWAVAAGRPVEQELFDRAAAAASALAEGHRVPDARLILREVEASIPSEPSDIAGFTGAQDCWICLDTALRSALGEFAPEDSTWYLLEPVFQDVSQRVYGYTDVGSRDQDRLEAVVLNHPDVVSAVAGLVRGIELLTQTEAPVASGELRAALVAIRPQR